jgi:hypothetical protein
MRHILVTLLLIGCSAFGQRAGGGGRGFGGGSRGGYSRPYRGGSVVVPYPAYVGGYYAGGYYPGYAAPPAGYGYDSYGAYPPDASYYGDPANGYGSTTYAPGYGPGYSQGYGPGYGDPSQQAPIVIVNPGYRPDNVNPVVRDYSNTPLPPPGMTVYQNNSQPYANQPYANQPAPPDAPATIYLIAMKDHTIFPTVAYWVDGDTLNYVTSEGVPNRVSLALVDRDFSKQLNDERHVDFKLPPAK